MRAFVFKIQCMCLRLWTGSKITAGTDVQKGVLQPRRMGTFMCLALLPFAIFYCNLKQINYEINCGSAEPWGNVAVRPISRAPHGIHTLCPGCAKIAAGSCGASWRRRCELAQPGGNDLGRMVRGPQLSRELGGSNSRLYRRQI